ncbi:hypothetical protein ACOWPH_06475 [Anabaena sp. PCC 7938]|uniref:Uncharacterized protein n=1 Tax=Anabaena cylindrica (strain ATCC 27899 / PCC 7122) TaxID=272123 RepID=K9ZGT2_ANACC|nr:MULTISPECIES: hypothetical protein [Anabaena]AFZ57969.1 hypothetical protein Anacy_2524 [Anabaena cylindrica PCC 7122]BAY05067.1 hypothetical protein NIES19_43360 [Anabaena cylindrica PCC 7122]
MSKMQILEELEDDLRWDEAFSSSPDTLAKLAATAMAEYHTNKRSHFFLPIPLQ